MEFQTKYQGVVELQLEDIIHFNSGIPGFPEEGEFIILPLEEGTFYILQSVKTPSLAFVMVNPFTYFPDYDFTVEDQTVEALKIASPDDVIVYSILTVQDPFEKTTANLQAPIIINSKNKMGKQIVLNHDGYTTRHNIMEKR
ncbi:flagellar assembly protein FliW [Robertmurraya sp. P23]|uniref:flagellar assembly protein FliW n=1 Tax=Robertmurraya sp. P23 TaxID=3436931 RepID=UPI003D95531D